MPRAQYQYGTSPRKYEPEYTPKRKSKTTANKTKKTNVKKSIPKAETKRDSEKKKNKKVQDGKIKFGQIVLVCAVFGMLFTLSYREISIMEMFNHKKELENQLAVIKKENGQVEKSITEVESTLDWNSIQQKATEQLGMQKKAGTPIELDKSDNVETENKLIKDEKTGIVEKIISFFINK